jgi:hypothetical protein
MAIIRESWVKRAAGSPGGGEHLRLRHQSLELVDRDGEVRPAEMWGLGQGLPLDGLGLR